MALKGGEETQRGVSILRLSATPGGPGRPAAMLNGTLQGLVSGSVDNLETRPQRVASVDEDGVVAGHPGPAFGRGDDRIMGVDLALP